MRFVIHKHLISPYHGNSTSPIICYEQNDGPEQVLMEKLIDEYGRFYITDRFSEKPGISSGHCDGGNDPELPNEEGFWVWEGEMVVTLLDRAIGCEEEVDEGDECCCEECEDARIGFYGDYPYFKLGSFRRLTDAEAICLARYNNPWHTQSGVAEAMTKQVIESIEAVAYAEDELAQDKGLSSVDMFNNLIEDPASMRDAQR